ncbi:PaaI family thioesterase [Thalassobaculum sp. OXR-137]|uniref:PaaI family thioesterase n=1 Tax=Thalassobaculum sp. OXR-137 TaxID=3100173 RepID=UPI002AC9E3C0|nr:PaaI family thioesterase [Thalassobaculum sp. OXR-137]WPZ34132.1 PaaI family thioesterase [Thalassobaculum sp. OXR-137]
MNDRSDANVKVRIANPAYAERVRASFGRQAFMDFIGAEIAEVAPGAVEIRLPYRAELAQQHGFFHGGIVGTLADNACGYASFSLAAADASVLTVEYNLNLMAPASGDLLIARGRVLRPGRTLVVAQADVFAVRDGREKQVATALATLMLMAGMADEPHEHKSPGMDGTP